MKSNIKNYVSLALFFLALLFIGGLCEKENNEPVIPNVTTLQVADINPTFVRGGGEVIDEGDSPVTERGVCYGTVSTPTINDNKTTMGSGIGEFIGCIENLMPNTLYYLRAFATSSAGTGYGAIYSFTTQNSGNPVNISDIDGNIYNTVTIGDQVWMSENLRTTRYNDGSAIPSFPVNQGWKDCRNGEIGAYAEYNNDPNTVPVYGRLYNWYAVNDERGLCPPCWRVPTDDDWKKLVNFIGGGFPFNGGKLKETGSTHWASPNTGATDEVGFTALPAGLRHHEGYYQQTTYEASFWTASKDEIHNEYAWAYLLVYNKVEGTRGSEGQMYGFSVRCMRDKLDVEI